MVMRRIALLISLILCLKLVYGDEEIKNKLNVTIEDVKTYAEQRSNGLKNIKFLYIHKNVQQRNPEWNYKQIVLVGKVENKVCIEEIAKYENDPQLVYRVYFFDGKKGYSWDPATNICGLNPFKPFAESHIGYYMLSLLDWTASQPLTKTLKDDDFPEIIESYEKDNEKYVVFKCNLLPYDKDDLKYMDKSELPPPEKDINVFKYVYNISKNMPMYQEFFIKGKIQYSKEVDESLELSPGVYFPVKITAKGYEKKPDGKEFQVRGISTIIFKNVSLGDEEELLKAITFEIPSGAKIINTRSREESINGDTYIEKLPQEEIDSRLLSKKLFGLSYQDLLNMLNEITY